MNRSARRPGQGPVGNIHGLNVDLAPTAGEHLYYREFARKVHAFRTDDLLPELAKVALMQEPPYSPEYRRIFPPWGLAAIAKESVLGGKTKRVTPVDLRAVRRLCEQFNAVVGRELGSGRRDNAEAILTRTAYEQFGYQESEFQELARSHALFVDTAPNVPTKILTPDAWNYLLGVPLTSAVGATFFLQVGANQNAGIYDSAWLDMPHFAEVLEIYPRGDIETMVARLTVDKLSFRAACREAPPTPGLERYGYNPLVSTPFVRLESGTVVAPVPRLIHRTITPGGLYYPGVAKWGQPFAEDLGAIVEAYVGRHLDLIEGAQVHGEVVYDRGQKKSIDWFVVFDDLILLIEVKAARLALGARAADSGLLPSLKRSVGNAYEQLERTAECLRRQDPNFAHLPHDRPMLGLVVTAEPLYTANQDEFRNALPHVSVPTMVASLREIEDLVMLESAAIPRELTRIATDRSLRQWSLGLALRGEPKRRNPILEASWNSLPFPDDD